MFIQILLFTALYVLTIHFLNKIKNLPPSPFPALPIVGHLYLIFKKPLHRTLSEISAKHGPILLLKLGSRRVLLVSSPTAAEECFTKNDVRFANRPQLLAGKYLGFNYSSLAWAPYGNHWRKLRKILSLEILSTSRLHTLSSMRMDEVRSMIRRLLRNQNQPLEMRNVFFELTTNIMMRMITGKMCYGENVGGDMEVAKKFKEIVDETVRFGGSGKILDFLPWLKWIGFGGAEKRLMVLQEKRKKFMQILVEEHRNRMRIDGDTETNKTMIEIMLSLQESDPEFYADETIGALMLILLAAGADTTMETMEWAMALLLNNSDILKKAQIEIDNQIGFDRLIDEFDLVKLPYLRCITYETLRLYPPGPLLVPHESSEECMVGGFRVPRGTMLLVNAWAIQNDQNFWEDSKKFMPERFEGIEAARDGFKFMPFGSGRRSCPGESLAIRMIVLTLGSLIQCFEWEKVGETMVDMSEGTGLVLFMAQPLQAKCRPRPTMLKLLSQI